MVEGWQETGWQRGGMTCNKGPKVEFEPLAAAEEFAYNLSTERGGHSLSGVHILPTD